MKARQKWFYHLLAVAVIAAAATLLLFICYQNAEQRAQAESMQEKVSAGYLRTVDEYGLPGVMPLRELFDQPDSLQRLKDMNKALKEEFTFLEFDSQHLTIMNGTQGPLPYREEFRSDYNTPVYRMNDQIGISLLSVQVGAAAYDQLHLDGAVYSGSGFSAPDFSYRGDGPIPALLGYEYKDLVEAGQTFSFDYLSREFAVTITGFLEKDTYVVLDSDITFLDTYIVIPLIDVDYPPADAAEAEFLKILYSQKNWGYIQVEETRTLAEYTEEVKAISSRYDLLYTLNGTMMSNEIDNVLRTMDMSRDIFQTLLYALTGILCAIYCCIVIGGYNRHKKRYAIHLLAGATMGKIRLRLFAGIALQFITGMVLAVLGSLLIRRVVFAGTFRLPLFIQSAGQAAGLFALLIFTMYLILLCYMQSHGIFSETRKDS